MQAVYYAIIVGVTVYVALLMLIPKRFLTPPAYTRTMLDKLEEESGRYLRPVQQRLALRESPGESGFSARLLLSFPGGESAYRKLLCAGLGQSIDKVVLVCFVLIIVLSYMFRSAGGWGVALAVVAVGTGAWMYIKRRIARRNQAFIVSFPDALDMIVRSVRSGYPLNAAVKMVADNMPPPVSTEFRQVADETAYGSSLIEALQRMSQRIDEPDIRFFVVVLAVQQEVGGNLAEVLSNLSAIIRKRKHLYMKVKALSSEGRATAWVLGLLPVFEFLAIYFVSPEHLTPLFETPMGNMILLSAISIVLFGVVIVRKMINIEV